MFTSNHTVLSPADSFCGSDLSEHTTSHTSMEISDRASESDMDVSDTTSPVDLDKLISSFSSVTLPGRYQGYQPLGESCRVQCSAYRNIPSAALRRGNSQSHSDWHDTAQVLALRNLSTVRTSNVGSRSNKDHQTLCNDRHLTAESPRNAQLKKESHSHKWMSHEKVATTAASRSRLTSLVCYLTIPVVLLLWFAVLGLLSHNYMSYQFMMEVDTEGLQERIESRVFGQHIAVKAVSECIDDYFRSLHSIGRQCDHVKSQCCTPPLVLSFHGWSGVGKSHLSEVVVSLFPVRSVTKLSLAHHFPHAHLQHLYRQQIHEWILSNITRHHINFFIIDEMDRALHAVVHGMQDAISDLKENNNGCNSPTIFILLSNHFAVDINSHIFTVMESGRDQQSITREDLSFLFENPGLDSWYHQLQSAGVITAAIPFLPLQKQQVLQCIQQDLASKGLANTTVSVENVLRELSFTAVSSGLEVSHCGCKRVSDKVDLIAYDDGHR